MMCYFNRINKAFSFVVKYRNYPFFVVKTFLNGTRPKICYSNIPVRTFFSIEVLLFGRMMMIATHAAKFLYFSALGESVP